MWLKLILSLLGPLLKALIERWLGGAIDMEFKAYRATFLEQADSGLFRASKRAVAAKLFDAAAKQLEQVKVGSRLNVDEVVSKAKAKIKADMG